jgi:hypothetical protein
MRGWAGFSPSGAKARVDFAGFMYGLKPIPFTEVSCPGSSTEGAFSVSFTGANARVDFPGSMYGLKPVPSTKVRCIEPFTEAGGSEL